MIKFGKHLAVMVAVIMASIATASYARAEAMECLITVYTAQDVMDENADPMANVQIVSMPIVDGEADVEVQVRGETVRLFLWKYEHTDMYKFEAMLKTPKADLPPLGPSAVAIVSDNIYNDGPTKNNGWDINPGPKATRFVYLNRQTGTFGFSTKLLAALKSAGKWGTYPYDSTLTDVQNLTSVTEFVREQVAAKTMQLTDVIGLSTVFSCSLQK